MIKNIGSTVGRLLKEKRGSLTNKKNSARAIPDITSASIDIAVTIPAAFSIPPINTHAAQPMAAEKAGGS